VPQLSSSFGVLALVLAAVGVYGVTSYGVARRRAEIGVRVALGARRSQVVTMLMVTMLMAEAVQVLAIGLGAGVAGAITVSRAARSLLFGLNPTDPWTIGAALMAMTLVVFVATALPASRAARVSPVEALRDH
jgi:ABC-type antimicrobial peptide transport system permease subunit